MHEHDLPHFAFFDALSRLPGEESPEWRALSAQLLVLRLGDYVHEAIEPVTPPQLRETRRAIDSIAEDARLHSLLWAITDAIEATDTTQTAARLHDLGRVHLSSAAWTFAADVYELAAVLAAAAGDHPLTLDCLLWIGHALRMQRRFTEAERQYARLATAAAVTNSVRYQLEAELGVGKLAIDRTDFPAAQGRLDAVIARARAAGCTVVLSKALQDRSLVAGERGDYEGALELAHEALNLSDDARERDRILINVAMALRLLGRRDAARDANLLVAGTAQELDMRWLATINLMEIAYLDGRIETFERYRVQLAEEPLPPALDAMYYEYVGDGCAAFDRRPDAVVAYTRMLSIAEEHGLAKSIIDAERALASLRGGRQTVQPARAQGRPAPAVTRIASEIRQQRIAAGITQRGAS